MLATVAERTAALCSVYHDGATLLQCIKSKRKGLDISATELELAITGAESAVRDQYERTSQRFGASYAQGDRRSSVLLPSAFRKTRPPLIHR